MGSRLLPLTKNRPKCMVELLGKHLLFHQLEILRKNNINDIIVVTGYLNEKIVADGIKKINNPKYNSTNMVYSLFCAEEIMSSDEDLLVIYGDIVYNDKVIKEVKNCNYDISVVVDIFWKKYWSARMNNPLSDAETLKIDDNGNIFELGKKPNSFDEIEGQYIGMIKLKKSFIETFKDYYKDLDKNELYDNNDFENMYMTSFLDLITKKLKPIKPIFIKNGWIEIDTPDDLKFHKFLSNI